MADSPNCKITYVPDGVLDVAPAVNVAIDQIDAVLQCSVINMDQTAPPGSPANGDLHIVASPATGDWTGQENNLARYVAEGDFWKFKEAGTEVRVVCNKAASNAIYAWSGSAWAAVGGG